MKTRFLKSIVATAKSTDLDLPWTRGARRTAFIVKRVQPVLTRKSA